MALFLLPLVVHLFICKNVQLYTLLESLYCCGPQPTNDLMAFKIQLNTL